MRKAVTILIASVLVLAGSILGILLLTARPRVSTTLVEYKRWPHGAIVRLTNGTGTSIPYVSEPDDTPAGSPVLCLQKTPNGWTNTSPAVKSERSTDSRTGKLIDVFLLSNISIARPGGGTPVLLPHFLEPGKSVEFFVRLEPDALPKRVGTVCIVPPTKFTATVQPWLARVKKLLRLKSNPLGHEEVWCATPLSISLSPQPTSRN
jgi:hypothetical protein